VDPRLHQLQAEAEHVKTADLSAILRDFHRDKLTLRQRHVAVAKQIPNYNANNTYQYVINREDLHLSWLEAALAEIDAAPDSVAEPVLPARGRKDSAMPLVAQDAKDTASFVERWQPRLAGITHDRHRKMLALILGETLEQRRFFEQIAAGREDALGRRANGPGSPGTGDGVLGVRWIE
jgi:predicted transposase YdaD